MKVLHVHDQNFQMQPSSKMTDLSIGGIPIYLDSLVRHQQERGLEISMIRFKSGGRARNRGYFELEPHSNRLSFTTFNALRRILLEEAPDIVHLHSVRYAINPITLRYLRAVKPLVYTLHDVTPLCFQHTKLFLGESICRFPLSLSCLADCYKLGSDTGYLRDVVNALIHLFTLKSYTKLPLFLVPSDYLAKELERNGFAKDRIRVIPHFTRFDIKYHEPESDECRILFAGRLEKDKGIFEFISALGLLEGISWKAVIVGDGAAASDLRKILLRMGLHKRVTFTGNIFSTREMSEQFRSCSFLVIPSLVPESFGLVGVEAMSFGKPVVAFESGGVTEWLKDGVNGFLVQHGDVRNLAAKIKKLINSADIRQKMGVAAVESVRERFTIEAHLSGLDDAYCRLIREFQKG